MKNIITLIFSISFVTLLGQGNIVPNSGFENYSTCPTFGAQWNVCTGWNNVNMVPGVGSWGTPDYFNNCGTGGTAPPNTFAGGCSPHTGSAMMALVLYNVPYSDYREYLSTQLSCSMTPGNTYTVSFWLSNGTTVISPWTIRNIGIHFSSAPLSQSGWGVINVVPQCEITTNIVSSTWTQYTFTVAPTASWNYLTIGSFRPDSQNNPTMSFPNPGGNPSSYANYFVDDIQVISPSQGQNTINFQSSSGNFSICSGQSLTLTANGATTYTWNTSSSTASISISPSVTTSYSVNALGGCFGNSSLSSSITISVLPNPTLSISGNSAICPGQTASLTVSGAATYTWSNGLNSSMISVNPLTSSVYSVDGTAANSNCSASASFAVNVSANPTLSIFGTPAICQGQTASLTVSGANSYSWSNGSNSAAISVSPLASTVYSVSGTVANSNCSATGSFAVNVSPNPTLSIAGGTSLCLGQSATLTASGASTYSWSNGFNNSQIIVNPTATSVYTVSGANSNCTASGTVMVQVNQNPTLSISGNTAVCQGNLAILSVNGVSSHTWNTGATTPVIMVNPTSTTSYSVVGAAAGSNCQASGSFIVQVNPNPVLSVTGNTSICYGQSTTLTASGASTYSWSNGLNTSVIVLSPASSSVYTLTGADNQTKCQASKVVNLLVTECLGFNELTNNSVNVSVYPNPFSDNISLHLITTNQLPQSIYMTDVMGKVVDVITHDGKASDITLETSKLPAGIYFIRISNQHTQQVIKVVKQ